MIAKLFRGYYIDLEEKINVFFEENENLTVKHVQMVSLGEKDEDGEPLHEVMLLCEEK